MSIHKGTQHSIESANLADLLERILDKGIVIAGDIKVKLVDIELLTLQIRLVICSVDKAKDMGIDWWTGHAMFESRAAQQVTAHSLEKVEKKRKSEIPASRHGSSRKKVPSRLRIPRRS